MTFTFHGSFADKSEALKQEAKVSGFIRERIVAGKTRYFVITQKEGKDDGSTTAAK